MTGDIILARPFDSSNTYSSWFYFGFKNKTVEKNAFIIPLGVSRAIGGANSI